MHPSYNRETALAAWTLVDLGRVHTLQAVAALLAEDSHQRVDRMVRSVRTFLNEKHKGLADRLKS
jgi:hypothetical protein